MKVTVIGSHLCPDTPVSYTHLERNDNYWGTPGIAKTFRFKVIPDAETRYTCLLYTSTVSAATP